MNLFKKIAITFVVLISILVGTGFYISSIYEEEVKSYILTEINDNLKTKVDIEEINFSVFKKFNKINGATKFRRKPEE